MEHNNSDSQLAAALNKPNVMPSLPDIYSGKLNAKRIKKYKKLAQLYNVEEGTVRDIFCSGAETLALPV